LWVTSGNAAAQRLYERRGYRLTGRVKRLPNNPELTEQETVLWLAGGGSPA
jgi:ribosomal protein S18 acetylase RimI-like enzyme